MATLSIKTKMTVDDFVEAAEQLPAADLEQLARRLLHIQARRKATNLPQREAELIEGIAQSGAFAQQARYHDLNLQSKRRPLTNEERNELHQLIAQSEAQTVQRLSLLVELAQLRRVSLPALMKQLQIKAPDIV